MFRLEKTGSIPIGLAPSDPIPLSRDPAATAPKKFNNWTDAEISELRTAVEAMTDKVDWVQISSKFGNRRPSSACRKKWKSLQVAQEKKNKNASEPTTGEFDYLVGESEQ